MVAHLVGSWVEHLAEMTAVAKAVKTVVKTGVTRVGQKESR